MLPFLSGVGAGEAGYVRRMSVPPESEDGDALFGGVIFRASSPLVINNHIMLRCPSEVK